MPLSIHPTVKPLPKPNLKRNYQMKFVLSEETKRKLLNEKELVEIKFGKYDKELNLVEVVTLSCDLVGQRLADAFEVWKELFVDHGNCIYLMEKINTAYINGQKVSFDIVLANKDVVELTIE